MHEKSLTSLRSRNRAYWLKGGIIPQVEGRLWCHNKLTLYSYWFNTRKVYFLLMSQTNADWIAIFLTLAHWPFCIYAFWYTELPSLLFKGQWNWWDVSRAWPRRHLFSSMFHWSELTFIALNLTSWKNRKCSIYICQKRKKKTIKWYIALSLAWNYYV